MKKILPKLSRIPIYLGLFGLALYTAYLVDNTKSKKQLEIDKRNMKAQIESFWELEKAEVDFINRRAEEYTKALGLKEGEPLPPSLLADEGASVLKDLGDEKIESVVNKYNAKSGEYSTKAFSIITLKYTVPEPGEYYAYAGLEANKELMGETYLLHPDDAFTKKRVLKALKKIARTKENSKE